jgi:hypothetical protein
VSLPVVPPPTVDSGEGEHGNVNDEQGSTDGNDHEDGGNGGGDNHGHGQGQDKGGGPKHSGD